ncbi:MAG TPA: DNA polymerase IV [Kineosporiaceae bacterium]|nr:DNA polymerase IV [Kineosporiaceae bacterium]
MSARTAAQGGREPAVTAQLPFDPLELASLAVGQHTRDQFPVEVVRMPPGVRVQTSWVGRWVLHVDLDQFIAAVEVLRRPELRGLPVIVGGDGDPTKRGVVSTASYEARRFGVQSGMPLRTAARRIPDAVFLPVDRAAYEVVSARVMAVLRGMDAVVEVLGWDEAFLGVVTDDPEALARDARQRVRDETRLESTVGIGRNKLQAKIATGFGKPAGVYRLTGETWFDVLGHRPPDALWGIGRRTAVRLEAEGVRTVRDLAGADPDRLARVFGPTIGPWLVRIGQGVDETPVYGGEYVPRSRSREVTFQRDLDDWQVVREETARMARLVAEDVAADGRPVARVVVKVRWVPFTTQTRGRTLAEPATGTAAIEAAALAALEGFGGRRRVRLIGVRAEFA